ncbi:hypothetical protein SUGI_0805530 [Cryptomeria japonica]|uniref:coniferin beta-glucosidase n=1 Tax=Cryptomeria japonica TaxID=3369 RepID=UPI0024148C1D|nr:coniferin beta-glucosidase [Cryptomeria japonica]GLJ39440.1 hypothetical protein SUGI_0805530 [Cryptomeria japonica]
MSMRNRVSGILQLLVACTLAIAIHGENDDFSSIRREDFPQDFLFGTASSAYQYEGAVAEGGRLPSIWDTYTHKPGNTYDGSNGDVAMDQYHRYMEDVQLMADIGMNAYRFSISWSRLIPNGSGEVNREGVDYYNKLIDELLNHGIEPLVTIYHFDLPQALQDSYDGWSDSKIVEDFAAYSKVCFREFGDRVKYWMTFNEPNIFVPLGYSAAIFPPQKHSKREAYLASRNVLLAHAASVEIYRTKYKAEQKGMIGIDILATFFEPLRNTTEDQKAAQRLLDYHIGWFLDPLFHGDFPAHIKETLGSEILSFSKEESLKLKGSLDFLAINHYSTMYVANPPCPPDCLDKRFYVGMDVCLSDRRDGVPIGPEAAMKLFFVVPYGIQKILDYIRITYNNPPVIVAENGFSEPTNDSLPISEVCRDKQRLDYHRDYMKYLLKGIRNGADVRGYMVWSLLDDFEFNYGYTIRFGLYYVDYGDNLKRYPKMSALWFKNLLRSNPILSARWLKDSQRNNGQSLSSI